MLALLALVLVLLMLIVLLRRPLVDLPPDMAGPPAGAGQTAQTTQLAVARTMARWTAWASSCAASANHADHAGRAARAVDERLAQAGAESRNGRSELLAAFTGLKGRLDQRFTAFDSADAARSARRRHGPAFDALQLAVASPAGRGNKACWPI